jgi:autotransporter passenger strand-loop-strand repeat protein
LSGGVEIIDSQGNDFNARISGGTQIVSGITTGTTIFAGGLEVVESGGNALGTTVSSGGTLELVGGGNANGSHLLSARR